MEAFAVRYESPSQIERFIDQRYLFLAPDLLVTVFCADRVALHEAGQALESLLPRAAIIGISASAAFAGFQACDEACSIVFSRFNSTKLRSFAFAEMSGDAAAQMIAELGECGATRILIFSAQPVCDAKPFLRALSGKVESAVCLYSPTASLIYGSLLIHSGAIAIAFENPLFDFISRLRPAYMPFGAELEITKIQNDRIVLLNGKPIDAPFAANAPKLTFAIMMEDEPVASIDGEIFARLKVGDRVRLGASYENGFACFDTESIRKNGAMFHFSADKPRLVRAESGCCGVSALVLGDGAIEPTDDLILGFEEFATRARSRFAECAGRQMRRDAAILALVGKLSEEILDRERLSAICPLPASEATTSYDRLTKLPGRTSFLEHIPKTRNPAVALLNVERFRDINCLYGFQAGDSLLIELSRLLASSLGEDMRLFRIGGDSFAALADDFDEERFQRRIEATQTLVGSTIFLEDTLAASNIRLAAGIAYGGSQVLSRAETALRLAKTKRGAIAVASEDDSEKNVANLKMLETIRQATLQPWWILAYYQPIARAKDGQIVKYEALIRLRDADGRINPPAAFLELAKRSRYYAEMTRAMFKNSLAAFMDRDESVAVNLAPEDLQNGDTLAFIAEQILSFSDPSRITIEVTESEAIEDYKVAVAAISEMKKLGVKIAIDDFGSGYSNFAYLIRFQADYLKIDGSIVSEIDKNEKAYQTLAAIVEFAKRLGLETIAEFISSEPIAIKAKEAGVDYWQGYFIGQPAPL